MSKDVARGPDFALASSLDAPPAHDERGASGTELRELSPITHATALRA